MIGGYIQTPKPPVVVRGTYKAEETKTEKDEFDMNKEQFIKTKSMHKVEIVKLKQDIKKHKLLIKQARIIYKLGKMKEVK